MPRLASLASSDPQAAKVEPCTVGHDKVTVPSGDMDALDAAEAAQFRADVQGHRHQEVGLFFFAKTMPSELTTRVALRQSCFTRSRCVCII